MTTPDHEQQPRRVSPIGQRTPAGGAASPLAPGRDRVAGVIGSAIDRLELQAEREKIPWPAKGGAYDGMAPGSWRSEGFFDETGNIPEECPVQPLGYEGETFYFIDTMGQVFSTQGKAMGVERMQILFAGHENFLYWAWPSFAKGGAVTNFKAEEARRDLYAACRKKGPWSPTDRVRGRGAWLDEQGELLLHCGEFLYRGGKLEPTGEHGEFFYARRPRTIAPWKHQVEAAENNPAVSLFTILCSWNFVRGNVDAFLFLGWLGVALMAGALEWRPSVFLVGDAGTGKSSLQNLVKEILGRGMIATTNATSAGLYQVVGHDTLPIGIDEIEGDDAGDQAQQIIKMARDAASGSMRIRGGADHKGVEFMARSAFMFSAINPPPINKASLSRLAMLQLRPLDASQRPPVMTDVDQIGPKLLRRVADHFDDFVRLLEDYKTVLHAGGHSSRGQMTFGTLLAAAHMLLGDEGMEVTGWPIEKLDIWGEILSAEATPEVANSDPNWQRCIEAFLTSPLDAFNKGERMTVGQVLHELINDEGSRPTLATAQAKLAVCGLGVLERGIAFEGYGLAIPISGVDIAKVLANTVWAGRGAEGSWTNALQQAPEGIVRAKVPRKGAANQGKLDNRHTIGGVQRRCMFVGMKELWEWQNGGKG